MSINEPEHVHEDLVQVWSTWWQMSGKRPVGFGAGAIPLSEMRAMLDEIGVRRTWRRRWLRLWDAMEAVFARFQSERMRRSGKPRTDD